jgi:hypothetical protein
MHSGVCAHQLRIKEESYVVLQCAQSFQNICPPYPSTSPERVHYRQYDGRHRGFPDQFHHGVVKGCLRVRFPSYWHSKRTDLCFLAGLIWVNFFSALGAKFSTKGPLKKLFTTLPRIGPPPPHNSLLRSSPARTLLPRRLPLRKPLLHNPPHTRLPHRQPPRNPRQTLRILRSLRSRQRSPHNPRQTPRIQSLHNRQTPRNRILRSHHSLRRQPLRQADG